MSNKLTIIGGTYGETCREPYWFETYGSGGRAACAVAGYDPKCQVRFVTPTGGEHEKQLRVHAQVHGFSFDTLSTDTLYKFQYVHPLRAPALAHTPLRVAKKQWQAVNVENALVFGMLEGALPVTAKRLVYDPQSPANPLPPDKVGLKADDLAIICNQTEARGLGATGKTCLKLADSLRAKTGASVAVVKFGARGAAVSQANGSQLISAIPTDRVFSVGSGDVFSAHFTLEWAVHQKNSIVAAQEASRAASAYVRSSVLPVHIDKHSKLPAASSQDRPAAIAGCVYLAAPFFNEAERWLVEELRDALRDIGANVFSPLHDVGRGDTGRVVPADINGVQKSDVMLAVLHNFDPGTLFEIGYARALNKPVIGLVNSTTGEALKMLRGSGCKLRLDIASAVYAIAWELAAQK